MNDFSMFPKTQLFAFSYQFFNLFTDDEGIAESGI